MKRPRAILFDNDGVLSESEHLHWAAWERVLRELGLPYVEAELRASVGKTAPEILTAVLDAQKPGWNAKDYDVHALALRKNDYYLELARTGLRAYPGVIEGLRWCQSVDIATAIVSNARRREVDAAVSILGIGDLLDLTISRDEAGRPKPDPLPYLLAAAQLEVEVADCLAVEDSPPGLEAALVGKIPGAAVLTNFPRAVMERPVPARPDLRPVWVGASIAEFFEWVRSLGAGGAER